MCSLHLTHPSGAVGSRHCGSLMDIRYILVYIYVIHMTLACYSVLFFYFIICLFSVIHIVFSRMIFPFFSNIHLLNKPFTDGGVFWQTGSSYDLHLSCEELP